MDVRYEVTCPACPVQIEGTVNGVPFYFRSRWGHWSLTVDHNDPVFPANPEWESDGQDEGDGPKLGYWMTVDESLVVLHRELERYVNENADA